MDYKLTLKGSFVLLVAKNVLAPFHTAEQSPARGCKFCDFPRRLYFVNSTGQFAGGEPAVKRRVAGAALSSPYKTLLDRFFAP